MAEEGHYREIAAVQLYGDDGAPHDGDSPSHMKRIRDQHLFAAAAASAGKDAGRPEEGV